MEGFKLRGTPSAKFQAHPGGETVRRAPNVLEVQERARILYHHAKFGGARMTPATRAAKNVEFFVCLSVCLSVCLFLCLFVCPSRFCSSEFVRPIWP